MGQKQRSTNLGLSRGPSNDFTYYLTLAGVAIVYFGAAKLGLSLAFIHANVSPVWPPAGIAIAAVLLLGYRVWPGILVGAFLANFLTLFGNFLTPVSLATAGTIAVGNTLEALSAGFLLRSVDFHNSLDRAKDVFKFVLIVLLSTMVAATIGNLSLCLSHAAHWGEFGSLWLTWWLGDTAGALVVAPLLLSWGSGSRFGLLKKRYLEATLLLFLLCVSAIATFGEPSPSRLKYYPLVRMTVPFFLWAAFRLGQQGVTLANIAISIFAVWGTANGFGPFVGGDPNDALLRLQVFLGSNAVTFLFLVATVEERRRSEVTLRESERRLAANLAVTQILAESPAPESAMPRILETIGGTLGWEVGGMWIPETEKKVLRCLNVWHSPTVNVEKFEAISYEHKFPAGVGLPGRVWTSLRPAWIPDVTQDQNFPRAPVAVAEGLHGAFAFPIMFEGEFLGVMEFFSQEIREPDDVLLQMFKSIGSQIGQFLKRKRAEEALEIASRLPKENPSPVIRLDQEGIISYANPAAERLLAIWGLAPGDMAPGQIAEPARHVLAKGNKQDLELPVGNQTYAVDIAAVNHSNYVNLYFSDITDRKRAEEALRESEEQLHLALESASMGAWEYELQTGTVKWSNSLELIHGLEPGSFGGTIEDYQRDIHPEDRQYVLESLGRTVAAGNEHEIEYRIVRPDGTVRWVEGKGQVIRDNSGNAIRMIGVCMDITERKQSEEERERLLSNEQAARAEAEAANRTKDEFLALLSHELRTPLASLKALTETLRDGALDDPKAAPRFLGRIETEVDALAQMAQELLDLTRIESGQVPLDLKEASPGKILLSTADRMRAQAERANLTIRVETSTTLPDVHADVAKLEQVLVNIIHNAIKFTAAGGSILLSAVPEDRMICFSVKDTGAGIPQDELERVFERFYKADRARSGGGTGLGLSIARHIIEVHGGRIWVESIEGRGSTFYFTIPIF